MILTSQQNVLHPKRVSLAHVIQQEHNNIILLRRVFCKKVLPIEARRRFFIICQLPAVCIRVWSLIVRFH